jgi:hypothetical protein
MFGLSLANANNKPLFKTSNSSKPVCKKDNLLEGKRKKIAVNCKHKERRLTKESDRRERQRERQKNRETGRETERQVEKQRDR